MANDDGTLTDDDFTQITITVCLACADGDCHTCYGEGCECRCEGDEVGATPMSDAPQLPEGRSWCAGLPDRRPGATPTCVHGSFLGHWIVK